jgi:membrane protein insertase Oxa1/YidC/SpoIIIJ
LLQIPFFFYFASDLQRIIRGTDPSQLELARALQDGGALWFVDLTEPDPFFVLPIITGSLMYINVELATGRHSLSGTTTSKANFVKAMKDFFQSKHAKALIQLCIYYIYIRKR